MAGLNGKHRAVFLSQDGMDVTHERPPARVTGLQLDQVPVDPWFPLGATKVLEP